MRLGVVYSGNFYVPLDADMPPARAAAMRRVMPPVVEVTSDDAKAPCATEADPGFLEQIRTQSIDRDPLYGMFTSGSTGVPKGIVVSYRSVINMAERFTETFEAMKIVSSLGTFPDYRPKHVRWGPTTRSTRPSVVFWPALGRKKPRCGRT